MDFFIVIILSALLIIGLWLLYIFIVRRFSQKAVDSEAINNYINKNFNRVIRVSNVSPLLKADFLTPYSIYRIDFRVTDFNDFAYIAYTPDKNVIKIEDPINLFNKLSKPIPIVRTI